MNKIVIIILVLCCSFNTYSQQVLMSWSQQSIEGLTKDKYDVAQKLTSEQLLQKNLTDETWCDVFLTLNASVNHQSSNKQYLAGLADQITNNKETSLKGTSRLIIWERVITGEIIFEGKGLVIDNDLFKVCGRANQLLQNLTKKNFGYVLIGTTEKELSALKNKWQDFLAGKPVEEFKPAELPKAKIPELTSLTALRALIVSLKDNPRKQEIIKNCLKKVYNLDEMPSDKSSTARLCNPDAYTFGFLGMLTGEKDFDESKAAEWWEKFWNDNKDHLIWDNETGRFKSTK